MLADSFLHRQNRVRRKAVPNGFSEDRVVRGILTDQHSNAIGVVGSVDIVSELIDQLAVVVEARANIFVSRNHPQISALIEINRSILSQLSIGFVGVVVRRE